MTEYMQTQARICPLCHDDHSAAMSCEYYEQNVKVSTFEDEDGNIMAFANIPSPLLHFVAVKNGMEFNYHEKTEFDARTKASCELGACSDFYRVDE